MTTNSQGSGGRGGLWWLVVVAAILLAGVATPQIRNIVRLGPEFQLTDDGTGPTILTVSGAIGSTESCLVTEVLCSPASTPCSGAAVTIDSSARDPYTALHVNGMVQDPADFSIAADQLTYTGFAVGAEDHMMATYLRSGATGAACP